MKKLRKFIYSAAALTVLTASYGALDTIHAATPHRCLRPGAVHAAPHDCGHSENPRDWHGIGEVSQSQKEATKSHGFDGFPCSCTMACFFNGAMAVNRNSLRLVLKRGLFARF